MATAKSKPTVAIVNPKDPSDPKPWIANADDVALRGWTLWADRHDPDLAADKAKEQAQVDDSKAAPADEKKPAKEEAKDEGSAVSPSEVKKAPGKRE